MVLHNYVCSHCEFALGKKQCDQIKNALDTKHIYGNEIERHPAKISSQLGFNLSLVKGIYKTRCDKLLEGLNDAFVNRLGSIAAVCVCFSFLTYTSMPAFFVNED